MKLKLAIVASEQDQYRIAEQVGIDETLLSMYVNGRRVPPPEHRRDIAKALKKRVADLFLEDTA